MVRILKLLLIFVSTLLHVLGNEEEFVRNDGDIPVVEGIGGNYNILEEGDVLILTRETFNHIVHTRPVVLVEFYSPWCDHCKKLDPEYSKAAGILREKNIPLAKVDATKEVELAAQFMVQSYPTIILLRNGAKEEDYLGARTADGIVEYMMKKTDPDWKPPASAVLVLTSENFTNTVQNKKLILVEFYAPWCGHCKKLEPEYEAAAKVLKVKHGIPLAKIDGTANKDVAEDYDVHGWPTLLVFHSGKSFKYKGQRDQNGIVSYMKQMAEPPSTEIKTVLNAKNNMNKRGVTVFGFFNDPSDLYEEYMAAAYDLREQFTLFHTFESEVADYFGMMQDSVVVFQPEIFHSKYEDKYYIFSEPTGTYTEIVEFVKNNSIPLVGQRTFQNQEEMYKHRPLLVAYYDVNFTHHYVKDTQLIRQKILDVANKFRDEGVRFAISSEEEYENELEELGLADTGSDVVFGLFIDKFRYSLEPDDDLDTDDLEEFVRDGLGGKLRPHVRSQPIPRKQEGPVRVVVGRNFEQEVMRVKKDVLLEFYAPWCGHCKKLEPIYKKLAKKMKEENSNLIFAKYDSTANDVPPQFTVSGFPTIYFVPAFNKYNPIVFTGSDRSYETLQNFVDQHASVILNQDEGEGGESNDDRDEL